MALAAAAMPTWEPTCEKEPVFLFAERRRMMGLGMGVMIGMLAGNKTSTTVFSNSLGKTISNLEITDKELVFTFSDGHKMALRDEGQSCCENRYMHTDDELSHFIGSILLNAEILSGPTEEMEYGEINESQFLVIETNIGKFTVVNYNEHNGYYGGFLIRAIAVK